MLKAWTVCLLQKYSNTNDLLGQQGYPRSNKVLNYIFTWTADISLTKMNYIQLHRDYHLPQAISSILKRKMKSRKL